MLAENGDECDPIGYPLAGMGINRATNAALYAAQIIGLTNPDVQEKVRSYRASLSESVKRKRELLEKIGVNEYLKTMDA